jgi:tetratricopeptide (TPR) repeat protein
MIILISRVVNGKILSFRIWALPIAASLLLILYEPMRAGDLALETGDYYCKIGNYDAAVTEYKRYIFFNGDSGSLGEIYYKLGMAYRNQGVYSDAISALRQSIALSNSDSVTEAKKLAIAVIQIAASDYSGAEFGLLNLASFSDYPDICRNAHYFLGVCYLYTGKWENARTAFAEYNKNADLAGYAEFDSLLFCKPGYKQKSVKIARLLSTFLPGAGQIYAGNWWDGLNAIAINTATGYMLTKAVIDRSYEDLAISHIMMFQRYYRGNRYNAEKAALKYNEDSDSTFRKAVFDKLENIESRR